MKRALLVIDAQKIYTDPDSRLFCEGSPKTIDNINRLIRAFRASDEPVIFIRHVYKEDGSDRGRMSDFSGVQSETFSFKANSEEVNLDSGLEVESTDTSIVKNRYSSFVGTDLDKILRDANVERVVICGFMTNFCCESAARHAHDLDYFVDFIVDATGTPGTKNFNQDDVRRIVSELLGGALL